MGFDRDNESHAELLSEHERHILSAYGKVPRRHKLAQQKRVYFDPGDIALSAVKKVTDEGAIQTGTSHPVRESISHPYAPAPTTSNISGDESKRLDVNQNHNRKIADSPLFQVTENRDGKGSEM
ncbi:hypothetical protein ASPCAL14968 [Aspergillus calidoustus]|uniref:mRNA stability protein n=1 Tax=Aspergillus calidoustus TaxID=454130 RepID=A0A0U5GHF2_ASPCI|nr:hypothetical protein ASPCAL14968 [Aspergillus calidoustus]